MAKTTSRSTLVLVLLAFASPVFAADKYPDVSDDGLERVKSKSMDAVYWQQDATLDGYTRIKIDECQVEFKKNWLRNQNSQRTGLRKVTAEDMERIGAKLSKEFTKVFTKELQENGNYEIVQSAGEDVLLLKPTITDLDVRAPDLKTPGRSTSFVTSAGEMTLSMELYDSATNSLIGRVIDRARARDIGTIQVSNSVTNKTEADRILRRWAALLREALGESKAAVKAE